MADNERTLAENTAFALGAELLVMGTRAVTVFVLASRFGKETNGVYVGLLAMLGLLAPAAQWGMNHVGVRAVSRGEPMRSVWPRVLTSTIGGAVIGVVVACLLALWLFDVSLTTVVLMGVAQLVGLGVSSAATMSAEAHRRADVSVRINLAGAVLRIGSLVAFLVFTDGRALDTWAWFLAAGMVSWALVASSLAVRRFDGALGIALPTTTDLRHGAGFVFVQASATAQTDIDKVVLNGYGLEADAGVYGPGYRVAELATVPLLALVKASYGDFFRHGAEALSSAMQFARRLTIVGAAYGIVAGVGLWLAAPIVPYLIGDDFEDSVSVVRWLSLLPLLKGLQYFPANVLTGIDRHAIRSWLIFGSASLNLVLNLALVPDHGWRAAAWSTLAAESLFAVALWLTVGSLLRRDAASSAG